MLATAAGYMPEVGCFAMCAKRSTGIKVDQRIKTFDFFIEVYGMYILEILIFRRRHMSL